MYSINFYSFSYCGTMVLNIQSYLIFDNVSSEDVGNYTCSAQTLYAMATKNVNQSSLVMLQAGK